MRVRGPVVVPAWLSCVVAIAGCVFMSGCTATHTPPVAEGQEPEEVREEVRQVSEGAVILREFCTGCHPSPDPAVKQPSEWYRVVVKMQQLARDAGRDTLTQKALFAVADYLEACAAQRCESQSQN